MVHACIVLQNGFDLVREYPSAQPLLASHLTPLCCTRRPSALIKLPITPSPLSIQPSSRHVGGVRGETQHQPNPNLKASRMAFYNSSLHSRNICLNDFIATRHSTSYFQICKESQTFTTRTYPSRPQIQTRPSPTPISLLALPPQLACSLSAPVYRRSNLLKAGSRSPLDN